jgi:putative mRNA 3-end processing factor
MLISDFITETKIGLFCTYGNFYLDPKVGVKDAVISHAHGDHACSGNENVYCTETTSLFMLHRYKHFAAIQFHLHPYRNSFNLNGVEITFIPAGHILGSAQVLMEYQGVRYLYTGDYKLQADQTCEPIEFIEADVLITESTFANPLILHPPAEEEIQKLNATHSNILLGAYTLGKSQRLVRLINDHCKEKRILIHHSIMPFVKIYEQHGIPLGKHEFYDRKVFKSTTSDLVYLVPPLVFAGNVKAFNVVKAFASGWSGLQRSNGIKLYLSDHADWNDILKTIDQVKPKEIWTTHGDGLQLKSYFKDRLVVKLLN